MIKCDKCGSILEKNAKFCTSCGEKISDEKSKEINREQPTAKVKVWIFRTIAFIIALFTFTIARAIFTVMNDGTINGKLEMGGILLFYGVYSLLSGLFLKDSAVKKRGAWILAIYIIGSMIFSYYIKNSSFGIDEELRQMSTKTPIKIDENSEISMVSVNGNNVTFKYRLLNIAKDDIPYSNLKNFNQTIKDELCKDKVFLNMMKNNKIIDTFYYGKDNGLISNTTISTQECR